MIIELKSACGCTQLKEISDEQPPPAYKVALYFPVSYSLAFEKELDLSRVTTQERVFRYYGLDYSNKGTVKYLYREER